MMFARSKTLRIAAICSFSLGISACGEVDPYEARPIEWTELDDGSFFAERNEPDVAHMAERCWPEGEGYTCVVVSQSEGDELLGRSVTIASRDELREEADLTAGYPDGYNCNTTYGGGTRQAIRANGEEVESNSFGGTFRGTSAWTKEHIENRLARYGVEEPGYFDCLMVLGRTGVYGSPENLRTDEDLTRTKMAID